MTERSPWLYDDLDDVPDDIESSGEVGQQKAELSPTALQLDDWSIRKGQEILAESEMVQKSMPDCDDAELNVADFHSAAFEPSPTMADNPKDERIARYMRNLMETPEFKQLHRDTVLDEEAATMATAHFAKGWAEIVAQEPKEDEFDEDLANLKAAAKACDEAAEEVKEWNDMGLGLGLGGEGDGSRMPTDQIRQLFKRVRNSHDLRRILDWAGRFRRLAQAQQRQKVTHGQDEVDGIELAGDISRLLTSELSRLADPDLELITLKAIIEQAAMCYSMKDVENVGKGPIVVYVDESGSMYGEPIAQAKGIAVTMYWIARHQRRWCLLSGFSSHSQGHYIAIPPNATADARLVDWLEHFYGQGTDLYQPLISIPSQWATIGVPEGKTDILLITDDCCHVPDDMARKFNEFKQRVDATMTTIVINAQFGNLGSVSDRHYLVNDLDLDQDAVRETLSI
tara:strand:+ start:2002 stop:3366 length:1365 start_codon:yes stop_codon:yes gene_type:complete